MHSSSGVKSAAQTGQEVKELSSCRGRLGSQQTSARSQFPGVTLQVLLLLPSPLHSLFLLFRATKTDGLNSGELLPVIDDAKGSDKVVFADDKRCGVIFIRITPFDCEALILKAATEIGKHFPC